MDALLFLIKHRLLILCCSIFYGGHQFAGPMWDGTKAGCTRCLKLKDGKTTNVSILETFNKREESRREQR